MGFNTKRQQLTPDIHALERCGFTALFDKNAHGMPEDNAKAVEWYLKTANQGGASAQATVGSMYYSGKGVTQNYAKAIEWYSKAAN